MNTRELMQALGVSQRRLTQYTREGMPVKRGKRGNTFDPAAVAEWAAQTGRPKLVYKLGVAGLKQDAAKPVLNAATEQMTMEQAIDDLTAKFRREAEELNNAPAGMRPFLLESYVKIFREKLMAEKAIHKIKLEAARSIPFDDVAADYAERVQSAKSRLLSLPAAVAGRLAGRTESEINDLLSTEIRDICNAIADEYKPAE